MSLEKSFFDFIAQKSSAYTQIDTKRMPEIFEKIKNNFSKPKHLVQIVGTNGKGSTGRFLSISLANLNFSVGHYTSPHIFNLNERIWKNKNLISDGQLEQHHQKLLQILNNNQLQELSYFEYTTLLAYAAFEELDFAIMEAGLGGEFDATSVFEKDLSLITPIDIDHKEFLGDTIDEIATTKLNSITKNVILSEQNNFQIVEIAKKIAKDRDCKLYCVDDFLTIRNKLEIKEYIQKNNFPKYFEHNIGLAISGLMFFGNKFDLNLLNGFDLQGRLQKIAKNITIDVGHNHQAAQMILKEFEGKKISLIYGTLKDKDYKQILRCLKPITEEVLIVDIGTQRGIEKSKLEKFLQEESMKYCDFEIEKLNDELSGQLDDNLADCAKNYLVFGSFYTVESFMKSFEKFKDKK